MTRAATSAADLIAQNSQGLTKLLNEATKAADEKAVNAKTEAARAASTKAAAARAAAKTSIVNEGPDKAEAMARSGKSALAGDEASARLQTMLAPITGMLTFRIGETAPGSMLGDTFIPKAA